MKLHTVFITYNRLELTKRALSSYLETVTLPYTYVVVDNGSEDGTQQWLDENQIPAILLKENRYPGFATNAGWVAAPESATHLHRADNDFTFLPRWCRKVEHMFTTVDKLGQLGLRTDAEEGFIQINTGGNCVVARELWDQGLRWDERPWPQLASEVGAGWTEDSLMSRNVERRGWKWARVQYRCIQPISQESADDSYYKKSWADRGIYQ